jgi:hypothetical protein
MVGRRRKQVLGVLRHGDDNDGLAIPSDAGNGRCHPRVCTLGDFVGEILQRALAGFDATDPAGRLNANTDLAAVKGSHCRRRNDDLLPFPKRSFPFDALTFRAEHVIQVFGPHFFPSYPAFGGPAAIVLQTHTGAPRSGLRGTYGYAVTRRNSMPPPPMLPRTPHSSSTGTPLLTAKAGVPA